MSLNEENLSRDHIVSCLTQQLSEYDVLKSMYPDTDEIILSVKNVIDNINNFINGKSDYIPSHLDFILTLIVNNMKLEICVNLPTFYPEEEPDIYIRCNQMNRHQETNLNKELSNYIKSNHIGEVFLYTIITWLQDDISSLTTPENKNTEENGDKSLLIDDKFVRLWIYSHHIYNKKKREEIVKKSKELNVTGFCLPGKPGIICIEGCDSDCKEWWREIKSLNWKKIVLRKTEIFEICDQNQYQKFKKFEEIHFQNPVPGHNKNADMSAFSKFMEERGLTQIFNEIFGLCNDNEHIDK